MSTTDKMKNAAQSAKGNAKVAAGRATGNRDLQVHGEVQKRTAATKQAGEKVKDALK